MSIFWLRFGEIADISVRRGGTAAYGLLWEGVH